MDTSTTLGGSRLSRLKLFIALSRTPHGLLDMTTPALGAVLWLGTIPPLPVILLGCLTAFAGYTAVYALNDVVDYRVDREKIKLCGLPCTSGDLDAAFARHPLAQGFLSLKEGILWTVAWGAVALMGAYALNPRCAVVFLVACLAETVYCLMLKVSYLRTIVSGAVKTAGGIAAVFAVAPDPSPAFVVVFFLWLFLWEIGGQNIPNDICDANEDRDLRADTVPVRFGLRRSTVVIAGCLASAVLLSLILHQFTPARPGVLYLPGALLSGTFLLLLPALNLLRSGEGRYAPVLFNKASYYPLTMFIVTLASIAL